MTSQILNDKQFYPFMLVITAILGLLTIRLKNKEIKALKLQQVITDSLLNSIKFQRDIQDNLVKMLAIIGQCVGAQSYGVYLFMDDKFVLKAIRKTSNESGKIGTSYSGLLPYKKLPFIMPSSLPGDFYEDKILISKENKNSSILIPVNKNKAVILVGDVERVSKRTIRDLNIIRKKLEPVICSLLEVEDLKGQGRIAVPESSKKDNTTVLPGKADKVMETVIKAINASGGLYINEEGGQLKLNSIIGLDREIETLMRNDFGVPQLFNHILNSKKYTCLTKGEREFFQIPPYFIASEAEMILAVSSPINSGRGIAVFWYEHRRKIQEPVILLIEIMIRKMENIIYGDFKDSLDFYWDNLKMISEKLDNLDGKTIGCSELMHRYSKIVAREMKLSLGAINDIALAAYISGIGRICFIDNPDNEYGFSTKQDIISVKAEIGASIIESIIGEGAISNYIRYSRMPINNNDNRKAIEESIFTGSRIIAVVETFVREILIGDYGSNSSYERAIDKLKLYSGTKLDEKVVNVLMGWFEKKQLENLNKNRPLGYCFEMRCPPENICAECEAYKNTDKSCWEMERNNCALHGNSCDNCYIYTEFIYRKRIFER